MNYIKNLLQLLIRISMDKLCTAAQLLYIDTYIR